jgi:hypothetical protein
MFENWIFYAIALLVIIVAAYMIKKVASCMLKIIVFIVLLAALGFGYFYLF